MPEETSKLPPMADERYCVIGAGAAGLGTMEVLQRNGIAFDCFEQSERVGGHWPILITNPNISEMIRMIFDREPKEAST